MRELETGEIWFQIMLSSTLGKCLDFRSLDCTLVNETTEAPEQMER
jgi:hypothetical protein